MVMGVAFVAVGCSDDSGTSPGTDGAVVGDGGGFGACTNDRPDWKQCSDGKIQVCHIVSGMDPHFHWGADCAALGLSCVNIDNQGKAACVDESKSCAAADEKCDSNTAYFCVDGKLGQEPCGTAAECHAGAGEAPHCEEKGTECGGHGTLHGDHCDCDTGYKQDPADKTNCIAEKEFAEIACDDFSGAAAALTPASSFADWSKAHAELDKVYELTLSESGETFLHFDVKESGEYVIFLSEVDALDTFLDESEQAVTPAGGVPNGKCATAIKDHWHADMTLPTGSTEMATIVRFKKATAAGQKVKILIKHNDEHDH
jgi:hypothetical protein